MLNKNDLTTVAIQTIYEHKHVSSTQNNLQKTQFTNHALNKIT